MTEKLSENSVAARWEALLKAAKLVHGAFMDGRNPTEYALNKLAGAIAGIETRKTCGHRLIEDCYCDD